MRLRDGTSVRQILMRMLTTMFLLTISWVNITITMITGRITNSSHPLAPKGKQSHRLRVQGAGENGPQPCWATLNTGRDELGPSGTTEDTFPVASQLISKFRIRAEGT